MFTRGLCAIISCVAFSTLIRAQAEPDRKPFPSRIPAPAGMEKSPGPWSDPVDKTGWPNTTSRANSDPWLAENHDAIRVMRPRLLLINFSNEHGRDHLDKLTRQLIAALAESTRYHGYRDPKAPAFLQYEVFKFIDLRDADSKVGNSKKIPVKDADAKRGFNMKYRQYFTPEFAELYAVPDPRDPKRFLRLDELLDAGYVHEVWFFESGNVMAKPHIGSYEVVEEKPKYDAQFRKVGKDWLQAGNGGDADQPWTGRSCRIGCVNASRGIGCYLESLAHGMEYTANSGAIPYLTKYFREYADFNLKKRYGLPFDSLYSVNYAGEQIEYPDKQTMKVKHGKNVYTIENYVPAGGSAHFPPNARGHYDLNNSSPVMCTIEDWRIGSGPGGKDLAKPFTNQAFRNYRDLAPDCMGAWLVYWRQNMPGLGNKQKDDAGEADEELAAVSVLLGLPVPKVLLTLSVRTRHPWTQNSNVRQVAVPHAEREEYQGAKQCTPHAPREERAGPTGTQISIWVACRRSSRGA